MPFPFWLFIGWLVFVIYRGSQIVGTKYPGGVITWADIAVIVLFSVIFFLLGFTAGTGMKLKKGD